MHESLEPFESGVFARTYEPLNTTPTEPDSISEMHWMDATAWIEQSEQISQEF